MDLWTHVNLVLSSSLRTDCFANTSVSSWCWFWSLYELNTKEKAVCWFCGCEEDNDAELVCAARVWRGILDCILLLLFFSNICDYIKEGPVLLLLFPSLSLSPLIGPLKHGVCVCCFVLFVLSGCYVVMLCVKKNKINVDNKKKKQSMIIKKTVLHNTDRVNLWTNVWKVCHKTMLLRTLF